MQYHASLITADGAYHCLVGSIMAIFIIAVIIIIIIIIVHLSPHDHPGGNYSIIIIIIVIIAIVLIIIIPIVHLPSHDHPGGNYNMAAAFPRSLRSPADAEERNWTTFTHEGYFSSF